MSRSFPRRPHYENPRGRRWAKPPDPVGSDRRASHDGQAAEDLLKHVGAGTIDLADKAYDADRIRASVRERGALANIPPKTNRRPKPYFSTWLCRERNRIERFFSKLKHFRRVATRYDKLAENFLAMAQLASMRLWLRVYEFTA